ncbi:MAG: ATP-binding protein [Pyrinomonadaceae bacterium]
MNSWPGRRTRGTALVLTAHTADDQAETVLLNLLRGGGAGGLGGMRPVRDLSSVGDAPIIRLVRPLLAWARRDATQKYCLARGVEFRSDAMNDDAMYARVRARQQLIPLLETFNPRAVEALARGADLLREDAATLDEFAAQLLSAAKLHAPGAENSAARSTPVALRVKILVAARPALRRRALRQWIAEARGDLRRIQLSHVLALEKLLDDRGGGRTAELPGGYSVERRRGEIRIMFKTVDKDGG